MSCLDFKPKASHVRVLLKKDFITLRRTSLLSMIILPVLVMAGFSFLTDFFEPKLSEEQHNFICKPAIFVTSCRD